MGDISYSYFHNSFLNMTMSYAYDFPTLATVDSDCGSTFVRKNPLLLVQQWSWKLKFPSQPT
jgi:hypothetical protein